VKFVSVLSQLIDLFNSSSCVRDN